MATDGPGYQQAKVVSALYKATPGTLADGDEDVLQTDAAHGLKVAGHVAHDGVDLGNPIKIGGKASALPPAAVSTDLDRVDASFNLQGAQRVIPALPDSAWSITNASAVNALATATKAAGGAGVKHVCTGIQVHAWNNATGSASAATGYNFAVRDGATGAGTILWQGNLSFAAAPLNAGEGFAITFPTPLVGTANTAMCVECISTALTNTGSVVNAQGYDTK